MSDAVKNNNGTIIRLSNKHLDKDKLIHELYLTEQQLNIKSFSTSWIKCCHVGNRCCNSKENVWIWK